MDTKKIIEEEILPEGKGAGLEGEATEEDAEYLGELVGQEYLEIHKNLSGKDFTFVQWRAFHKLCNYIKEDMPPSLVAQMAQCYATGYQRAYKKEKRR